MVRKKRRFGLNRPSLPVIGADGIIYVGSTGWQRGYGFRADGTVYFTTAYGSGAYGGLHAFSGTSSLEDINEDTSVDIQDVILALRMCLVLPAHLSSRSYLPPYPVSAFYRADFNGDRSLDIRDVINIVRKTLGY